MLEPISRMEARIARAKTDSDTTVFLDLLLFGEMLVKLAVAGLVSLVDEDKDRSRYRCLFNLVRADSIGKWSEAADEILQGPLARCLCKTGKDVQRIFTSYADQGWQAEAPLLLESVLQKLDATKPVPSRKLQARRWLALMAEVRNKSLRGHGAQSCAAIGSVLAELEKSIHLFAANIPLFSLPWAYLRQNLSRRYRVIPLGTDSSPFDPLKRSQHEHMRPGVYIAADGYRRVDLLFANEDLADFHLPNGGFRESRSQFEVISYITGDQDLEDGTIYLSSPAPLPVSSTTSRGDLERRGSCLTNAPTVPSNYVERPRLQEDLKGALSGDRHWVVTLGGRGGIGKTLLALRALNDLQSANRFDIICWFSARDVDLTAVGPKPVRPDVLTLQDIARAYVVMAAEQDSVAPTEVFGEALTNGADGPTLFVFDNFETVRSPREVFAFLSERIRPPNKVLITTRHQEFNGDYAITVGGMERQECAQLISEHASQLGIADLVTEEYGDSLIDESEGHPYVIKMLLGEVAKARKVGKVERIVASRNDILAALFDRTFGGLSTAARRIFLALSAWRAILPRVAIDAVLLRNADERVAVDEALDDLRRFSLVEVIESTADAQQFVAVPLTAALYGREQLRVSPLRAAVEADLELLRAFGAGQKADVRHGVEPRIQKLFRHVAEGIAAGREAMERAEPMLRFLGQQFGPAWLLLADLYVDLGNRESEKDALRSYLKTATGLNAIFAWKRLALACRASGDYVGEIHAWAEMSAIPETAMREVSRSVNRVNGLFRDGTLATSDERTILLRRFATVMEKRIAEMDADDCSRLAWLHLQLRDHKRAYEVAELGLAHDSRNEHCQKIRDRILSGA